VKFLGCKNHVQGLPYCAAAVFMQNSTTPLHTTLFLSAGAVGMLTICPLGMS